MEPRRPNRTVLFLHSSAGRYGADRQLVTLAAGLDRDRFTALVALPQRGELAGLLEAEGIEVAVAPLAVLRRAEIGPPGVVRLARGLRRTDPELEAVARARRVALVHSNTSVVLAGHPLARRLAVPHVMHVRELYPHVPLAWGWWRRRLLRADRLMCVSEAVAKPFGGTSKAVVIHDGLRAAPIALERTAAREALGLDAEAFTVAMLGRVSDWKGQDVLARALAEPALASIGAVGLVAGAPWPGREGPLRDLQRLREALSLGDRLRLVGFRADVETVLGAADAVAAPSKRPDPFPNAALEAAAAGLPVVAAAVGGLPEMIRDDKTGLLVEPDDPPALAAALRRLADDPPAARQLGAAAAADVAERFTAEHMLAAVQQEYDALLRADAG